MPNNANLDKMKKWVYNIVTKVNSLHSMVTMLVLNRVV
jgi:hypothetical protein